jgi:hypothetical protein
MAQSGEGKPSVATGKLSGTGNALRSSGQRGWSR